jgi:NADH dehydrogenase
MKVLIVGGGFAGVRAALELARDNNNEITLISDKPDFQYYPTLYSSATGHSHLESWAPLGEIFGDHDNVTVYIDTVDKVDAAQKTVHGSSGTTYHYVTLVMAIGVVTTYFNIPGLETYAYGIKNEAEIKRLKQQLFVDIAEKGQVDKNYIIIGGGPTGVELAAAIGTYIKRLCKYYGVKNPSLKVRLVEAKPMILPRLSRLTSLVVSRRLKLLGVVVETDKKVERENAHELIVNGRSIESHTVIWTSGVANHPLFSAHPHVFRIAKDGRVEVDEFLRAHDDIYVIGDNASTPYTGLAQTAIHDAIFVTRNLRRQAAGATQKPYRAVRPVTAIPVGAHWAAIEWRWIRIFGLAGAGIRRIADFVGYKDVMPLGTSLVAWRAARVYEHDYFTPTVKNKKIR